jgi:hypothetical protein
VESYFVDFEGVWEINESIADSLSA